MIVRRFEFAVRRRSSPLVAVAGCLCVLLLTGCGANDEEFERTSVPIETMIAVAPALNFSGSPDVDLIKTGDLMASELSTIPGVGVIGVSRVLAVLADQGVGQIQSPEHAIEVCEQLGADAIVVFAVTEYNAYTPVVGVVAQLYGVRPPSPAMDPVAASRMARPFPVEPAENAYRPLSQVQRTFNANHEAVQHEVEHYAEPRDEDESPYGWRKYLASQEWFLRFCCFSVARELLEQQEHIG